MTIIGYGMLTFSFLLVDIIFLFFHVDDYGVIGLHLLPRALFPFHLHLHQSSCVSVNFFLSPLQISTHIHINKSSSVHTRL